MSNVTLDRNKLKYLTEAISLVLKYKPTSVAEISGSAKVLNWYDGKIHFLNYHTENGYFQIVDNNYSELESLKSDFEKWREDNTPKD